VFVSENKRESSAADLRCLFRIYVFLTQKIVTKLSVILFSLFIPDPGVKKKSLDPGSGSATLPERYSDLYKNGGRGVPWAKMEKMDPVPLKTPWIQNVIAPPPPRMTCMSSMTLEGDDGIKKAPPKKPALQSELYKKRATLYGNAKKKEKQYRGNTE
jgi:hypothetical protein